MIVEALPAEFYFHRNLKEKYSGVITIDEEDKWKLEIVGNNLPFDILEASFADTIIAKTKGTLYTFCNNVVTNAGFGQLETIKFYPYFIFKGAGLNENKDYSFNSIKSYTEVLEKWVNHERAFEIKRDGGRIKAINFNEVSPLEFKMKQKSLELLFNTEVNLSFYLQEQYNLSHKVRLKYQINRRANFKKILKQHNYFRKLFVLIAQQRIANKSFYLSKSRPDENGFKGIELILNRASDYEDKIKSHLDFFIEYKSISTILENLILSWDTKKAIVNEFIDPLLNTFYTDVFSVDTFIDIMRTTEAFERVVILSNGNYQEKLEEVFEYSRECFNSSLKIRSKPEFCKKVKRLRHDLSHYNSNITPTNLDLGKLYQVTAMQRCIISCAILKWIGIPTDVIKKSVSSSNVFFNVKK